MNQTARTFVLGVAATLTFGLGPLLLAFPSLNNSTAPAAFLWISATLGPLLAAIWCVQLTAICWSPGKTAALAGRIIAGAMLFLVAAALWLLAAFAAAFGPGGVWI